MRQRTRSWLLFALLLLVCILGMLLTEELRAIITTQLSDRWADFWVNVSGGLVLFFVPLLYWFLLVMIILEARNWRKCTPVSNQLDRLLQLKHEGLLLRRFRRTETKKWNRGLQAAGSRR